jgi:hypothetical protein
MSKKIKLTTLTKFFTLEFNSLSNKKELIVLLDKLLSILDYAHRCINGTDQAYAIAAIARKFLDKL